MQRRQGHREYHYRRRSGKNVDRIEQNTAQKAFRRFADQQVSDPPAKKQHAGHGREGELKPHIRRRVGIDQQNQRQSR